MSKKFRVRVQERDRYDIAHAIGIISNWLGERGFQMSPADIASLAISWWAGERYHATLHDVPPKPGGPKYRLSIPASMESLVVEIRDTRPDYLVEPYTAQLNQLLRYNLTPEAWERLHF